MRNLDLGCHLIIHLEDFRFLSLFMYRAHKITGEQVQLTSGMDK